MVIVAATTALATAPSVMNAFAEQPRDCFHKGTGEELESCDDERGNNSVSCNRGGNQCRD
jgi:hypothetical protein